MATGSSSRAVTCAENIALLYLLHSVPDAPSCNNIDTRLLRQEGYSLSFVQERSLASTLAFLANITDDVNSIPALCIEERIETASLDVVLAVNKRRRGDGEDILVNLKHRFDEIFAILSEVSEARDQTRALERRLFSSIVSMSSSRILSRLRFKSRRWGTPKQPLQAVIGEAITSLRQLNQEALQNVPVELFIERARDVARLADSWVNHQKPAELENLVEGVFRLKQVEDFEKLLDEIPNHAMCPSSRQNLANIVNKVSRYRETARILYRMARKVPLLRRAKVKLIDLPEESFYQSQSPKPPQLESTITRCTATRRGVDLGYLCDLLSVNSAELNEQFATQTKKSLAEAKIHAEIQLVVYYELNGSQLPPRVVCSSKDACFLCNKFIVLHGKMHTPRSHGRLYPGWRLPSLATLSEYQSRFNTALEDRIEESVRMLLHRKAKTVYPDPNESTLLTLRPSTSTLRTASALAEAHSRSETAATDAATANEAVRELEAPILQYAESVPCESSSESEDTIKGPQMSECSVEPATQSAIHVGDRIAGRGDTTYDTVNLIQGEPQVSNVAAGENPRFHLAGALEIHMECQTPGSTNADNGTSEIAYDIEWLSVNETKTIVQHQAVTILDVETLQHQVSHEIEYHGNILVMAQGSLVRIRPFINYQRNQVQNAEAQTQALCEEAQEGS